MLKRLLSAILAISILFAMSMSAFANEKIDYSSMPLSELSSLLDISTSDIQDLKSRSVTDEKFNIEIEHYLWAMVSPTPATRSTMSASQWSSIKQALKPGSILATKDSNLFGLKYGHVGIVYSTSSSPLSVEALGGSYPVSTSQDYAWWGRQIYTCKVFEPNSTTYMTKSANYAYLHLRGIPYSALCSRYVDDFANCSSLVWKAYYQTGYNIDPNGNNWETIYPRDIVESDNMKLIVSANWPGVWF